MTCVSNKKKSGCEMNYYYVDTYSRLRYPTHVFGIRISWKRDSLITHERCLFHSCSASFVFNCIKLSRNT